MAGLVHAAGRAATPSLSLLLTLAVATTATAQDAGEGGPRPAGHVTAHFLATPEGELGAAAGVDLAFPIGPLRLGGYFAVGALPSDVDARNRTLMPLALSVGLELGEDLIGVSLRARGGLWGGATQEEKLTAGGYLGGGAYLTFHLGGGARLAVGLDAWGLLGSGPTLVLAPGAGFTWGPAPPPPPEAPDPPAPEVP